jgi:hypothetical protein
MAHGLQSRIELVARRNDERPLRLCRFTSGCFPHLVGGSPDGGSVIRDSVAARRFLDSGYYWASATELEGGRHLRVGIQIASPVEIIDLDRDDAGGRLTP